MPPETDERPEARSIDLSRSHRASEKIITGCLFLIRYVLYAALYLLARAVSRQEVSVLVYHSVGSNGSFYAVSPERFRRQVEYLRKNYRIVSLDEIVDFVEAKSSLPRKSVALTFDDGYYDNYLNAYSYLREHGLPAAIFVTVGFVHEGTAPLGEVFLKTLNPRQMKEMSQNKIEIGAHSMRHLNLATIDREQARKEIADSKIAIEEVVGRNVSYFAYPSSSYDDKVIDMVKSSGFKGAFGGDGLIHTGDNLFCLKRVPVDSSVVFPIFKARLTRAMDWYGEVERAAKAILSALPFMSVISRAYSSFAR